MTKNASHRPQFEQLSPEDQLGFGNGIGPFWFPDWLRYFITHIASFFFKSASWQHHDFGYAVGGDRWDRRRCDDKFLIAMIADAIRQPLLIWPLAAPLAILLSIFFYVMVRVFGQFGSFEYRERYATLEEIISTYA